MEGGLQKPTRFSIDWKNQDYLNEELFEKELRRVSDHCHGCRRCVSLCNSFPTLFDLIDESKTFEVDGVTYDQFDKVIDHCYLCDLCYLTKCPYVPPHDWGIDFPHLMLRGKAIKHSKSKTSIRDKILTSTVLKQGEEVEVAITLIDKRTRKVNLSMKAKDSVEEKAAMKDYNSQSSQASGSTLGDLLKEAKDK